MKPTIIPTLLAIALLTASCGGGSTTTTQNTTAGAQSADTTSTTVATPATASDNTSETQPEPNSQPSGKPLALAIAEELANGFVRFTSVNLDRIKKDEVAQHPYYISDYGIDVHCLPLKNGEYYVSVVWDRFYDDDFECENCNNASEYSHFLYKDGDISDCESRLPKPGINDYYANADKFPKNVYKAIEDLIADNDLCQYGYSNDTLWCRISPFDIPQPLLGLIKKQATGDRKIFPMAQYLWKGEQFVRISKPLEEDLKYFDTTR